jgi:hypothetical protein
VTDAISALAETNRLNAQTIKLVAEANAARSHKLQEMEQAARSLQDELAAEARRLNQLEHDLQLRQAKIAEAERVLAASAGQGRPGSHEPADEKRQAIADAVAGKIKAEREEHWRGEELQKSELTARAQVLAAQQEIERLNAESARRLAQLWPAPLRAEAWRDWRERVLNRAAAEGPAALLLARLHTAAAFEKSCRPLPLELVRDIGRSVYEVVAEDAERIAQALSQQAAGRFDLKLVRVGDRVDNKFMKPAAGGMVEVRAVAGWAVRDANGQCQFPADVS